MNEKKYERCKICGCLLKEPAKQFRYVLQQDKFINKDELMNRLQELVKIREITTRGALLVLGDFKDVKVEE